MLLLVKMVLRQQSTILRNYLRKRRNRLDSKTIEEALNQAIGTKANQSELDTHTGNDTIHITASERAKWNKNGGVTGVRGSAEFDYKTGQATISPEDIGLGNVDNTADSNKSVKYATSAGSASTSAKVSNKLTIASPINSYNDLYFRDEIVTVPQ